MTAARQALRPVHLAVLALLVAAGVAIRWWVVFNTDGVYFDLNSYHLVYDGLKAHGFEVYAHVARANWPYPPGYFPWVLFAGDQLTRWYDFEEAIRLGAAGFVPKSLDRPTLGQALQAVLNGEVYMPETAAPSGARPAAGKDGGLAARLAELTPQQLRVLQMIRQGLLNKQIAHELKIGETTVKAHVSEVLRKLKVVSRTQAVIETAKLDLPALIARGGKPD